MPFSYLHRQRETSLNTFCHHQMIIKKQPIRSASISKPSIRLDRLKLVSISDRLVAKSDTIMPIGNVGGVSRCASPSVSDLSACSSPLQSSFLFNRCTSHCTHTNSYRITCYALCIGNSHSLLCGNWQYYSIVLSFSGKKQFIFNTKWTKQYFRNSSLIREQQSNN